MTCGTPYRGAVQPNVLVVMTDQQRPDSCGVFGQHLPVTPVLDSLAARGTAFDQAFTVQPVCGPARAALQTGRYPTEVGCWRNGISLPAGTDTAATRLAALGYRTGYVGKWHLASDRGAGLPHGRTTARFERRPVPPERRGGYRDVWVAADALEHTSHPYRGHLFDEVGSPVELSGYRVDAVTDVALDRLGRLGHDRPFLLWVSYLEPHQQNDRLRTVGPRGAARQFADFEVPGDLSRWRGDWRWNYAQYLAACHRVDQNLGRLLGALEADGRLDHTVVVFTSDHGTHFRTRNAEYKRSPHDASIRVPLVVAGPGFAQGARRRDLVSHLDLVPTLVHAAGGTTDLAGYPLQDPVDRDEVLVQISESGVGRALRTRSHTLAVSAARWRPGTGHRDASADEYRVTHLYDNEADPHQLRNLAHDRSTWTVRDQLVDRLRDQVQLVEGVRPDVVDGRR